VVDPVPARGGAINGNVRLGFDSQKRPVVSYHKFDAEGNTQLYNTRLEDGKWKTYQSSDWNYRWWFEGGGSIIFEVRVGSVRTAGEGRLEQDFTHPEYGTRRWVLDEETLQPIEEKDQPPVRPAALEVVQSEFPGMMVRWAGADGQSSRRDVRHWLRWETLPANRDRARDGPLPEPTMLRLYEIK
jgi:hypothetical protein